MLRSVTLLALGLVLAMSAHAQQPPTLLLEQALTAARAASPELTAAREAVAAGGARERQAGAYPNPTVFYQREQTGSAGALNTQNVMGVEQALELGGTLGARREAGRLRREAAEARLAAVERQVDYEVTRAFALAIAAERRYSLTDRAAAEFARALDVSRQRLEAGDVSAYAHRRMGLESARYASLRAQEGLARRTARLALLVLIAPGNDSLLAGRSEQFVLPDSVPTRGVRVERDSLLRIALGARPDMRAAVLDHEAAAADARAAGRERWPVPVVSGGFKSDRAAGVVGSLSGFIAGVSLSLPLWDRRGGAVAAAEADTRRRGAELEIVRRRVAREVVETHDALQVTWLEIETLGPQLGAEARAAVEAAQVAYNEGEISLVEWLDAVRAYHEAESIFASLLAESTIRYAALTRAVGTRESGL